MKWSVVLLLGAGLVGCEDWSRLRTCGNGSCVASDSGAMVTDAGGEIDSGFVDAGPPLAFRTALALPGRTPRFFLSPQPRELKLVTTAGGSAGGYAEVLTLSDSDAGIALTGFAQFLSGNPTPRILDAAADHGSLVVMANDNGRSLHFNPPDGLVRSVGSSLVDGDHIGAFLSPDGGTIACVFPTSSKLGFAVGEDGSNFGLTQVSCFGDPISNGLGFSSGCVTLTAATTGTLPCPLPNGVLIGAVAFVGGQFNGTIHALSTDPVTSGALARTPEGLAVAYTTERALAVSLVGPEFADIGGFTDTLVGTASPAASVTSLSIASLGGDQVMVSGGRDRIGLTDHLGVPLIAASRADHIEGFVLRHRPDGWTATIVDGLPVGTLTASGRFLIALDCNGGPVACGGVTGTVIIEVP